MYNFVFEFEIACKRLDLRWMLEIDRLYCERIILWFGGVLPHSLKYAVTVTEEARVT